MALLKVSKIFFSTNTGKDDQNFWKVYKNLTNTMTIQDNHDWSCGNWEYFLQTLSLGHLQPRMGNTLLLCLWNETIAIFVASPFLSKSSILEKWYRTKNLYDCKEMQSCLDNGYLHCEYCLYLLNVFLTSEAEVWILKWYFEIQNQHTFLRY